MEKSAKIYVAGHLGLVGSAITRCLKLKGYTNIIGKSVHELDLCDQVAVDKFFQEERPEYVFLAAAKVGGIIANNTYRADFIYINLMIQNNIIHSAWKYGVKKLLFLGSTCIYPKEAPQPLKEEYLLSSKLEYTNEPYAIAKIAGLKMCESYNRQYKTNYIAVMPTNLYGPGDNFHLENSHVLPALLRKFHLGKCLEDNNWDGIRADLDKNPVGQIDGKAGKEEILDVLSKHGVTTDEKGVSVTIWGTGTPLREFMYSRDMAAACVYIMENADVDDIVNLQKKQNPNLEHYTHFVNIGSGEELSIGQLAEMIAKFVGFKGNIIFDSSKPDGTMRKVTDISILRNLGFKAEHTLETGLKEMYDYYLGKIKD